MCECGQQDYLRPGPVFLGWIVRDPLTQCGSELVFGGGWVEVVGVHAHMRPDVSYETD